MLHGMKFEKQRIDPLVRSSRGDVAMPSRLAAARGRPPWPSPGEKVLLQGGYDLLPDLLADFGLAGHRSRPPIPCRYTARPISPSRGCSLLIKRGWGGDPRCREDAPGGCRRSKSHLRPDPVSSLKSQRQTRPQDTEGSAAQLTLDVQTKAIGCRASRRGGVRWAGWGLGM